MAITKIGTPELFDFSATNTALQLPTGTTAQRPTSPSAGEWRFNTTEKYVEFWDGGAWRQIDTDAPYDGTTYLSMIEYAGNNSSDRDITGVGFDPDLTIVKNKGAAESWGWGDTVRGGGYIIYSNLTNAQTTSAYVTPSAVTDGFKISTGNNNYVGNNYIAYNFKAGGAPTATNSAGAGNVPTSGSVMIDEVASTAALAGNVEAKKMSVNTAAQFSIVKFTSQAGATNQVPHGLNGVPDLFIFKRTDSTGSWWTYTQVIDGSLDYFALNTSDGKSDSSETAPTSTTVYQPTSSSGRDYILYCFKNVAGCQKIGSYTGNGNTTGPIVNTGFEPRFLLIKSADNASNWILLDKSRTPNNPMENDLKPNKSDGQQTGTGNNYPQATTSATGFQVNTTDGAVNGSGTYIYLAIA